MSPAVLAAVASPRRREILRLVWTTDSPEGGRTVDAGFLERLLGGSRVWAGPCTVILDAEAAVKTPGPDSIAVPLRHTQSPH